MAILRERVAGRSPSPSDWQGLYASAGYRHLVERERAMRRPPDDAAFRSFLESDSLLSRAPSLGRTVAVLEHADLNGAAARALRYLPIGTPLRATMYLEIKPSTNSFVFTGADSIPSIFLYVRPHDTSAQLENTLAHELHHIGLNGVCGDPPLVHASQTGRPLLRFLGAFGEGEAMLAAAGSPNVNPHVADDDSIQQRWNRDVANAPADIAEFSAFFNDVLDGRIVTGDSVRTRASRYYGVQGPWYTVGWLMASTIERERGRTALIADLCEPTRLLEDYNHAAQGVNARGGRLPRWDDRLVARLITLRKAAD